MPNACRDPASSPSGARPRGPAVILASGRRERRRIILTLLQSIRSGRFRSAGELGGWGDALLAARLVAESAQGLDLTRAGRTMLAKMSPKHAMTTEAIGASAPALQPAPPALGGHTPLDAFHAPPRRQS